MRFRPYFGCSLSKLKPIYFFLLNAGQVIFAIILCNMTDRNEAGPEIDGHNEPLVGEPQQPFLDDGERIVLRGCIQEVLARRMGSQGILASELAVAVASAHYDPESDENVRFTTGDVEIETSRMMDVSIRIAPNRRLYPM